MICLLDANTVIALLTNRPPMLRLRMRDAVAQGASIAVSSITLFELWYGVARSAHRRQNAERLRAFLSGTIDMAAFDEDDAATAGELRATLAAAGKPIGPYDLRIAAQALRNGWTLVTANAGEFARVNGLAWQNWAAPA